MRTCKFPKIALLWLCLTALAAFAQSAGAPQMNLERTQIHAGMHRIEAQVATTAAQRQTGLMYRREMPQHEGMLFIFPQPARQCFWMKNTLIPLTAAFIDDDGTIVNLADMTPQTLDSHCSLKPVRYVLEMNQGWFAARGIEPGLRLRHPMFSAADKKTETAVSGP